MDDNITVNETAPKYKPSEEAREPETDKRRPYSDYSSLVEVRYEIIHGVIYAMASPSTKHQRVSRELLRKIADFLDDKPCEVFAAPFDVFLNTDEADIVTVIPDISVVCDNTKLTDKGCDGAPDLVVEILSPGTARHDLLVKLQLYEQYGVRECWIADPAVNTVTVYILDDEQFRSIKSYAGTDVVPVHVLEGCEINLSEVFAEDI